MNDRPALPTVIAHVDMNTFFVSVERLHNPDLNNKPVAVGGDPAGRSVVSSASYEAREYGIHSAMPMAQAVKLCPDLVIVAPHFGGYQRFHDKIKAILQEFTPLLEMMSIDEGYLDLTGSEALLGSPGAMGGRIREQILKETCLPSSIGISANKMVSKIASDLAKPVGDPRVAGPTAGKKRPASAYQTSEGVIVVPQGQEAAFLAPLPVTSIPGCGKVTSGKLHERGFRTIGQLAKRSENELALLFGEHGKHLWHSANGRGSTRLSTSRERKSISKERTFREDIQDVDYLRAILHKQTESVGATLRHKNLLARTVTIKVRYAGFETHTYSQTLAMPTRFDEDVFEVALKLLGKCQAGVRPVRLIGVGVSNLVGMQEQTDMFRESEKEDELRRTETVDALRERFGKDSIYTGESVNLLGKRS
ncbi:MAG: DNA polymerase IV [Candidatus Marinimicrobia bacterium]|nr:DNA polymerase IV [Candidatus Neomarinimicrobiota bacterium]